MDAESKVALLGIMALAMPMEVVVDELISGLQEFKKSGFDRERAPVAQLGVFTVKMSQNDKTDISDVMKSAREYGLSSQINDSIKNMEN